MKSIRNKFKLFILCVSLILNNSCQNHNQNDSNNNSDFTQKEEKATGLQTEYLGNYHGIQPRYFMKNQYGDDMVINGNKVSVPSIDYKFLLKENNVVNLQQINLEDNSRVYYDGTYKMISEDGTTIKIECSLSDGKGSNPTYTLTINGSDKKGICTGSNEPEFSITKNKTQQK